MDCVKFIDRIIQSYGAPTTVIICSSREDFLEDLQTCIQHNHPEADDDNSEDEVSSNLHTLLVPTIQLIAVTQSVNVAYMPTLAHLRGYLSVYPPTAETPRHSAAQSKSGSRLSMLVIWGLAALHRSTPEHSAQGLSRTVASAVEAAYMAKQKLTLVEPAIIGASGNDIGFDEALSDPWKEKVPLLNGNSRAGGRERVLALRAVDVGSVIGRWCKHVRTERQTHD